MSTPSSPKPAGFFGEVKLPVTPGFGRLAGGSTFASATADVATCNKRSSLAFLSGTLHVTLTVVERKPERSATFQMRSEGSGASSTTNTTLAFRGIDDATEIAWTADTVAVTGLLKIVPRTVLQAATQKVIAEVWLAIQTRFAATDPTP